MPGKTKITKPAKPTHWTPELKEAAFRAMCEWAEIPLTAFDAYTAILRGALDNVDDDSDPSDAWNNLNFDIETFQSALHALQEFQEKTFA